MSINVAAEIRAYQRFIAAGMTPAGACGLIGNLQAESDGFYFNRVEYLCLKRLKENGKIYTDASYTAALDSGKLSCEEFLHPIPGRQYGYGIAQWTSPSRKSGLYTRAKQAGKSISDEDVQIEFLLWELENSYPDVLKVLKTATSIRAASDIVLKKFEAPSNTGESVCAGRAARGQRFYDEYVKTRKVNAETESDTMTESELRKKVVDTAVAWLGCREADGSHRKIIDLYNSHKPLARGYAVRYTDAWCATFVSAVAIKLGLTDIMPTECGCGEMIRKYQQIGRWQENDAYVPQAGDIIMYDWGDSGKGDCTGEPEHVGIVVSVSGGQIKIIEGNKNDSVAYRTIAVNGRYIRGYCLPDYASKEKKESGSAATKSPVTTKKEYRVQAGGFTSKTYADKLYRKIKKAGFDVIRYKSSEDGQWKVQCGSFTVKANADALAKKLRSAGFSAIVK